MLTAFFDVTTSLVDATLFSYPMLSSMLALYVPFLSGPSPYPFGLAHEITTAILLGTLGPTLVRQVRKIYSR